MGSGRAAALRRGDSQGIAERTPARCERPGPQRARARVPAARRRALRRDAGREESRCRLHRELRSDAGAHRLQRSRPMIEALGLRKAFGAVKAVDGVGFVARDGEITGLLGPNGAGKTTTLRMLYTLMTTD